MNRDEAKNILLLYRSDADVTDPLIATALSFMKSDPELREWFDAYSAQQLIVREKFRRISAPPGLKEQIISERQAMAQKNSRRDKFVAAFAVVAIVASLAVVAMVYLPHRPPPLAPALADTFTNYEGQMLNLAINSYAMPLVTNDLSQIQSYLAKNQSPSDYTLPAALDKAAATGCEVQGWMTARVSMICFRTGNPLPAGHPGDLWLFVAPNNVVNDPPANTAPQLAEVDGLSVATWARDGNIYLLATPGDQQAVQKYL
jgi:hypothetical protein